MPSAEVEPAIQAGEWQQTNALDRAATAIGTHLNVFFALPYTHYDYISSFIVIHSLLLVVLRAVSMITPMQTDELMKMSVEFFPCGTDFHTYSQGL